MKRLLAFACVLFSVMCGVQAASPTFNAFLGSNGITVISNSAANVVIIDGNLLTNGSTPVYVTTNLFVVNNAYISNIFVTNINVNQTLISSNIFVTNLFAGNTFTTNLYSTNIFVSQIFAGDTITTNLYATNIFVENNYSSNIYTTNIFVEQTLVTSNIYVTNILVENITVTTNLTVNEFLTVNNTITTNLNVVNNFSSNIFVTNINVNQTLISSNVYVTNLYANTIIGKDILWTNDNGTVRLIDETRIGIGTNAGDAMFLLESGTNAINALKYSTNGLTLFMVKSNGDLSTIRGVAYAWPNAQGAAGTALTNDGSGNLGWSASIGSVTLGMLRTNIFTTNVQGSPVVGALWLQGTTGGGLTNGARTAFEYSPTNFSLRIGTLFGNGQAGVVTASSSTYSNYWDPTNVGIGTVVFGSNNMARGVWSTIAGGTKNIIETNSDTSFIGGGSQNFVYINSINSTISGGTNNTINSQGGGNTIGGGGANLIRTTGTQYGTIGGGNANTIGSAGNCQYATIGGGVNNQAFGPYTVVSGGNQNTILSAGSDVGPSYATIAGGNANIINFQAAGNVGTAGTISGGSQNLIGSAAAGGSKYATISGGLGNFIDGDSGNAPLSSGVIAGGAGNTIGNNGYNAVISGGKSNQIANTSEGSFILGGISNRVTVADGGVVGFWTTNSVASTVKIGVFNTNAVGVDQYGLKAEGQARVQAGRSGTYTAIGGTLTNSVGPIVNAGATETNLLTYTVTANVLTNTGDRIIFRASGRFNANGNNKQLKAIWGSETILDTTAQAANSGAWVINGEIIRTGNTAQFASADYNGNGLTLFTTANSKPLVQTNGIATVLKITGTATADGDITNNTFTVEYRPTFPNQ